MYLEARRFLLHNAEDRAPSAPGQMCYDSMSIFTALGEIVRMGGAISCFTPSLAIFPQRFVGERTCTYG